jgi:hypothetical protein
LTAFSTTYTNDRDVNMTFDAAGNVKGYTTSNDPYMHYDAASRLFTQFESGESGLVRIRENYQDGDGAKVFYKTSSGSLVNGSYSLFCNYFLIRSSVLGGKVLAEFKDLTTLAENDPLKYYSKSYVYLKGVQLGFQEQAHKASGDKHVIWTYHNPTVGNYFAEYQLNNSGGQQVNHSYGEMTFDPLGSYVGISQPPQPLDIPAPFTFVSGQYMEPSGKCYADYVETPCTVAQRMLNNGTGQHASLDPTATVYNPITKKNELALFTTDWDNGYFGFVPTGANYNGGGSWNWRTSTGRPTLRTTGAHKRSNGGVYEPEPDPPRKLRAMMSSLLPQSVISSRDDERVFVVSNVAELEKQCTAGTVSYLDGDGIAQCARLPLAWEIDQENFVTSRLNRSKRLSENWKMGKGLTYGLTLQRGTVVATFDRRVGKYAQTDSGRGGNNHTAIFLEWETRGGVQGMKVIQQMSGHGGRAEFGFIPFNSSNPYHSDAGRFNVVIIPK